jgi:hypothetical protein
MNIELKLSIDEINYIDKLIELTRNVMIGMQKKDQIFVFSIVLDIGQKVAKKCLTFENIYAPASNKKYKMKFKYHEAVILEKFVLDVLKTEIDDYNKHLGRNITSHINQKLA